MQNVGTVESVWRYPVKSMAGEAIPEAFVGYGGVYGDRMYAVLNTAAPKGFPFLTGRERSQMLLYRPRYRDGVGTLRPPNQAEAEGLGPGLSPVYADASAFAVDVETPAGQVLAADDAGLLAMLAGESSDAAGLSITRSDRANTDCRPVSLISLQTIAQLGEETQLTLDKRRFRGNIYAQLAGSNGFAEDAFVGRRLQIGPRTVVAVIEQDSRCKMIGIDPDTAQETPDIPRKVARAHGGNAGVYCAVMVEGMIRPGDAIVLLD